MYRFPYVLALLSVVNGTCLSAEDLQQLNIQPLQRHPINDQIVIERDWWNGHYITTEIGRILLQEAMGFPVTIADYQGSSSFDEMTAGRTDINFEVWVPSQVGSIYQSNIHNGGPTGLIGRVGLYFPSYLIEDYPMYFELWRSYLDPVVTAIFPRAGTSPDVVPGREFVPPWCLVATEPPGCDIYGADYDNLLCNVTAFEPGCMTIWSYDFTYDGAWMHQQIRNLGLNWTLSHQYDYTETVAEAVAARTPFVVYSWSPNEKNERFHLERMNFREISPQCVSDIGEGMDGIGSVNCDFQVQVILKIYSDRMTSTTSLAQAAQFVRSFTLTTEQQESIIYQMVGVDPNPIWGTDPQSTLGIDLACQWVKNNTEIWQSWIVNIPPPPLPYLTFWYNASVIALFYTALAWPVCAVLILMRRNEHPLVAVPTNDLLLGFFCPLFALFIPIGIQIAWKAVGCYTSLWLLALVTPISFIVPLFVSHSVVIEVLLQELRSAVILKRITNASASRRLGALRILKSVWCQIVFSVLIASFSVFLTIGVNQTTKISDNDEVCTLDRTWKITMLTELIFYVILVMLLAPTLLKAGHRRAFFVKIFPISFLFMAVAVSAMFQTDVMTDVLNPFSFNAVFSLHWLIAVLVFSVVVVDPTFRTLGSCKLHKTTKMTETDVELSLTMLLDSAVGFRHFLAFSREQFCEENVLAVRAVYRFQQNPSIEEMDKIWEKSINRSSLFAINISAGCFAKCEKAYNAVKNADENPSVDTLKLVFVDVETELRRLVDYNLVMQFKNSNHFENFLAELEDKNSESGGGGGFRRLKSRLGLESKRSVVELAGNSRGGGHEKDDSVSQQPTRESHSKPAETHSKVGPLTPAATDASVDYLGLPVSFSANTRVSKAQTTTSLSSPKVEKDDSNGKSNHNTNNAASSSFSRASSTEPSTVGEDFVKIDAPSDHE